MINKNTESLPTKQFTIASETRVAFPQVLVVIVNWNGMPYLHACLDSLLTQTYPNFRITLVDNLSSDGSIEYVKSNYPRVLLITNSANLGFARACNVAIRCAQKTVEYVLLLNPDTILQNTALEKMVSTAAGDPRVAVVGAKILIPRNDGNHSVELGLSCDIFGYPCGTYAIRDNDMQTLEVFYVSGCAMLIKTATLKRLGTLDSTYFMFAEDLDFCWRAHLCGFKVVVDPSALVLHKSGGSIVGGAPKDKQYTTNLTRIYLRERNTLRTLIKNYEAKTLVFVLPIYLLFELLEVTFFVITSPAVSAAIVKAAFWNLRNLKNTMTLRKLVQSSRSVSDGCVLRNMRKTLGKVVVYKTIRIPRLAEDSAPKVGIVDREPIP